MVVFFYKNRKNKMNRLPGSFMKLQSGEFSIFVKNLKPMYTAEAMKGLSERLEALRRYL